SRCKLSHCRILRIGIMMSQFCKIKVHSHKLNKLGQICCAPMLGHMQEQRPNIILITTDQQRGDCLGSNGNQILQTPNLDALASKGVNFTRSYVTCPVCIPARRTLISGMSPDSHKLRGYRDGLPFDPPATLPGCLGSAGYQTQLI